MRVESRIGADGADEQRNLGAGQGDGIANLVPEITLQQTE
jgi:hypothetical protein